MAAQVIVMIIGAATFAVAAALVTPQLFSNHLHSAGENDPTVHLHALQALAATFAVAMSIGLAASFIAAGAVSWLLVRRVAHPVEELATAAEAVAAGEFPVSVADTGFSSEMSRLFTSFNQMAAQLDETDAVRNRLLADLSHELRTPLATLEAYIDGLEDEVLTSRTETWQTMRDQVTRLRRLAVDIRLAAVAQEHALALELLVVDINGIVASAVAAALPRFQAKGVDLTLNPSNRPVLLTCDPGRIQQVLANLLDNALRHTSKDGDVKVAVVPTDDTALIIVRDNGEGIPSDQLAAVFERFHRVDPSRNSVDGSGSGLGLTIARAIVSDHHGTLRADSDGLGTGTSFTITLPVRLPSPPATGTATSDRRMSTRLRTTR
ncbi:MAG: HAMP domain-containing sensor histidine kinase [bacterium]|nr:HAMP domain-containing sensor histidine kinase [bacterium]